MRLGYLPVDCNQLVSKEVLLWFNQATSGTVPLSLPTPNLHDKSLLDVFVVVSPVDEDKVQRARWKTS